MKSIVIIPALNPDEKLIALVEELKKLDLQIVVVNDGSKLECSYIFDILETRFQCKICTHEKNMGKGAALKTGIGYASLKYPECSGYVTGDADGQHAPEDILKVAEILEESPNALVLGTRDFSGRNIPYKSLIGNRITSFVFLLSTGKRCLDTQTGLRGIPRKFTEACLSVAGNRYEYEMNLLLEFGRNGTPFIYVPITTIYLDDNQSSHFHALKDSIIIYLNILKYSLSSLVSAITDLSLFTVLVHFLFGAGSGAILAATVIARLISGNVNFLINKHWVFQSVNNQAIEARKYLALFCCQMMFSWFLVAKMSNLPIPLTFVKILVDTSLFFLSYLIQKKYIFHGRKRGVKSFNENVLHKTL